MWGRLQTKDKLHRFGVCEDDICTVCDLKTKSVSHLFFECHYADYCISRVMGWFKLNLSCRSYAVLWKRIFRHNKLTRFRAKVIGAAVAATLYHVWIVRNEALWKRCVPQKEIPVDCIKRDVIGRIRQCIPKKTSNLDREWLRSLCQL